MARTERDILNHLIETCRDGARGFRLAANHVTNPEVKRVFGEAAFQREVFANELVRYAQQLGGETSAPGTAAGTLHRGWMTVKDAMTRYDEPSIVAEAIRGEREAANAYAEAVLGVLPTDAREVIEQQYQAILEMQRAVDRLALHQPAAH